MFLFFVSFNGELTIDRNNKSKYVDEAVKLMRVRISITRHKLVEKIHHPTKINSNEYHLHMTCKWPIDDNDYTVVRVNDDENVGVFLNSFSDIKTVELCVKKNYVSYQLLEGHREFSYMLDLDNESTGFMSLEQLMPHIDKSQRFLMYNT